MSFFSKLFLEGLSKGSYDCPDCGTTMFFEDEDARDTLICPKCGYNVGIDDYGHEGEDEEDRYPSDPDDYEEIDDDEDREGEYEEVCGELSDDDDWLWDKLGE